MPSDAEFSSLAKLIESLQAEQDQLPPVEQWQPENCGDIDIRISRDGHWYHQGSLFQRVALVRLFARILRKENNDYYLVTPLEKLRIQVDDVPFTAVQLERIAEPQQQLLFTSNCGDRVIANKEHPIVIHQQNTGPVPYITIRHQLEARITTSVYYQLCDYAVKENSNYGVWSHGHFFRLD